MGATTYSEILRDPETAARVDDLREIRGRTRGDTKPRHDPLTCEWCLAPIPGPEEEENA